MSQWASSVCATLDRQRHHIEQLTNQLAIAEALAGAGDASLEAIRQETIRAMADLLPKAIAQAKRGKPALFRLVVRTLRLR